MSPRRALDEARTALMLLTRLPVGRIAGPPPSLAASAWAYPFAGLAVGLIGWAAFVLAGWLGLPPLAAALLALAAVALATGGLHFDGLADVADGFGGGRDRAHRLEIMRDSRIGSYGVLALVLVTGLLATAIADAAPEAPLTAFLLTAVTSRLAMLAVLIRTPPARDDGLGRSAGRPEARALIPGALLTLLLALVAGPATLWLLLVTAAMAAMVAARARARIGGQTGDVLGAVQLLSETVAWLVLAAAW